MTIMDNRHQVNLRREVILLMESFDHWASCIWLSHNAIAITITIIKPKSVYWAYHPVKSTLWSLLLCTVYCGCIQDSDMCFQWTHTILSLSYSGIQVILTCISSSTLSYLYCTYLLILLGTLYITRYTLYIYDIPYPTVPYPIPHNTCHNNNHTTKVHHQSYSYTYYFFSL